MINFQILVFMLSIYTHSAAGYRGDIIVLTNFATTVLSFSMYTFSSQFDLKPKKDKCFKFSFHGSLEPEAVKSYSR